MEFFSHYNDFINTNRIDRCLKSEICTLLDDTLSREKNWKTLASKLGINRYFTHLIKETKYKEILNFCLLAPTVFK